MAPHRKYDAGGHRGRHPPPSRQADRQSRKGQRDRNQSEVDADEKRIEPSILRRPPIQSKMFSSRAAELGDEKIDEACRRSAPLPHQPERKSSASHRVAKEIDGREKLYARRQSPESNDKDDAMPRHFADQREGADEHTDLRDGHGLPTDDRQCKKKSGHRKSPSLDRQRDPGQPGQAIQERRKVDQRERQATEGKHDRAEKRGFGSRPAAEEKIRADSRDSDVQHHQKSKPEIESRQKNQPLRRIEHAVIGIRRQWLPGCPKRVPRRKLAREHDGAQQLSKRIVETGDVAKIERTAEEENVAENDGHDRDEQPLHRTACMRWISGVSHASFVHACNTNPPDRVATTTVAA